MNSTTSLDDAFSKGDLVKVAGDARHLPLLDESIQCCVTSPPYWGLRKYAGEQELVWGGVDMCAHKWEEKKINGPSTPGENSPKQKSNKGSYFNDSVCGVCGVCGAWRGAYGLEPTVEMYIAHTVEILREIRRVLRSDGVCFWNVADSYFSTGVRKNNFATMEWKTGGQPQSDKRTASDVERKQIPCDGLKPKDLCLIPQRVALAAQSDGWWVRSMIVWSKPNPMPESVTDRPTDAYEHIIMLTKSERYFWDADAVREPHVRLWNPKTNGGSMAHPVAVEEHGQTGYAHSGKYPEPNPLGRNLRNVWTFATQPYSGAHFATFPEELPRRCILAATSSKGTCIQCGAPWERVVSTTPATSKACPKTTEAHLARGGMGVPVGTVGKSGSGRIEGSSQTIGFRPTCKCRGQHGKTQPCLVLDPFGGSGTTGRVALELNRRCVLNDIAYSAEYRALADARTGSVQRRLIDE